MEIYAAPKLSKYMTELGAYNVKSFTHKINQHTHQRTHTQTHTHTHTRARARARVIATVVDSEPRISID